MFDVKGLRLISNCSMRFVRNLINSSFEFEILIVSLPTTIGLKIERFLSKFLLKNQGIVIWNQTWHMALFISITFQT